MASVTVLKTKKTNKIHSFKELKDTQIIQPKIPKIKLYTEEELHDITNVDLEVYLAQFGKPSIKLLTPELADELDELPVKNRKSSDSRVIPYANAITSNTWGFAESAIVVSKITSLDGGTPTRVLLNGKTRIRAVKKARKAIPNLFLEHVDLSMWKYIDIGYNRNMPDMLTMDGWHNAARSAAALRILYRLKYGRDYHSAVNKMDLFFLAENHRAIEPCTGLIDLSRKIGATLVTLYYVVGILMNEKQKAKEFMEVFTEYKNWYEGDAAVHWREMLNDETHFTRLDRIKGIFYAYELWSKKIAVMGHLKAKNRGLKKGQYIDRFAIPQQIPLPEGFDINLI